MTNDRVEYNLLVEDCDVSIEKRKVLEEYRRIRKGCLEHIRGPSVLPVFAQLQRLAWNTVFYQTLKETLENPASLRENGRVIAGVDRVYGHQAARLW